MMTKLIQIYKILLETFGSQGWWPVTPVGGCHGEISYKPIYGIATKTEKQRFEIIIGAILTQNTAWKNVEKALINLSRENLVDIRKIRAASTKKLATLIKSAGYYNQKANRLKIIAKYLYENYKGNLRAFFNQNTEKLRHELIAIKGIGSETADSILLYAGDKPSFVIDAYTKRIFSRIGLCDEAVSYEELKNLFEKNLEENLNIYKEYHALIVELGKNTCRTKPLCDKCPVKNLCDY